jgi:hypothetical protein
MMRQPRQSGGAFKALVPSICAVVGAVDRPGRAVLPGGPFGPRNTVHQPGLRAAAQERRDAEQHA